MAERDQSEAPFVPPEVPAELEDVYRQAYLAAYAESGDRAPTGPDAAEDEDEAQDLETPDDRPSRDSTGPAGFPQRLRANLEPTPSAARVSGSTSQRALPPSTSAWSRFRASPWFLPLVWLAVFVVLVVLAYVAGRSLASSLS